MATKCPKCQTENTADSVFCKKCATQLRSAQEISITRTILKPSDELAVGSTFADKYKIIAEIGRGGMGVVYKAEDLKLKRFVAIKLLPSELESDEEAKERFIQEAQAAAALSHPNICTIHEVEESDEKTYIAMEYIDGHSLREKTVKNPLSTEETLDVAIQVAQGLAEAHKKGITHRDIKSANIMVDEKGQAKIMDFGLAKVAGGALITKEARPMGTVAYMSPEQARGDEVDQRTDIWALGVILYEMMSCQFPFRGDNEATVLYNIEHKDPLPIRKFKSDVPVEIEKVINRALKKRPESRYQSAEEVLSDLQQYQDFLKAPELGITDFKSFIRVVKRPKIAIPAILTILIVGLVALWYFDRQAKIRWARQELLPEIEQLVSTTWSDYAEAYELAEEAEKYLPDDPNLSELMVRCSSKVTIKTEPPGAKIYAKLYKNPNDEWEYFGISPIENLRVPLTHYRLKMEKDGYETVYAVTATFRLGNTNKSGFIPIEIVRNLDKKGIVSHGMVRVKGAELPLGKFGDFFIDQYEVTNEQYKKFLDSGGYRDPKYWKHEFKKNGERLSWDQAMREFKDQTGRPGPATWKAGSYPEDQENHPVSGVSWYEAAAYSEFAGKRLPTIYHWRIAARETSQLARFRNFYTLLIPLSNFYSKSLAPVGSYAGMTIYGAYDMAGNVREWCWNETPNGRAIRGGAWNDATYMFQTMTQSASFDRSPKNGFRCALYPDPDKFPEKALKPLQLGKTPNFYDIKPVPDPIFQVYKEQFAYDKTALNAQIEQRNENAEEWIQENITFDATYGDERIIAHLFLPKNSSPPYQTIIYFPGTASRAFESSEDMDKYFEFTKFLSFIVTNGRAVLYPVYTGTFERRIPPIKGSRQFSEYVIHLVQDLMRSIDYLETRSDINTQKLAYYGYSWGGWLTPIILVVEERFKAGISIVGALQTTTRPEISPTNYVTRVKTPILMLNGKHDLIYTYENFVKPMYDLLGTPEEDKVLKLYDTDHFVPLNELIKETLAWLDRYLGPVNR
jgi:serine/threonine protein kinase